VSVIFRVRLCRFSGVVRRMMQMTLRRVAVMRGGFMIARFVVHRRFTVMPRGVFVVLGCLVMMLCCLLGHGSLLAKRLCGSSGPTLFAQC
jgi:hypothetical protein